jgi:uncharacterized protein YdaL
MAHANEFRVTVEDLDVVKIRTNAQATMDVCGGHYFGWQAFWNLKPNW